MKGGIDVTIAPFAVAILSLIAIRHAAASILGF